MLKYGFRYLTLAFTLSFVSITTVASTKKQPLSTIPSIPRQLKQEAINIPGVHAIYALHASHYLKKINTSWKVPAAPQQKAQQNIFIFPSIQGLGTIHVGLVTVLPTLAWHPKTKDKASGWTISCFSMWGNPLAPDFKESTSIKVKPGEIINGSASILSNGRYQCTVRTKNKKSELNDSFDSPISHSVNVSMVLEANGIDDQCQRLPGSDLEFTHINITNQRVITVPNSLLWAVHDGYCGVEITINRSTAKNGKMTFSRSSDSDITYQ